jgi:hypothetical protein
VARVYINQVNVDEQIQDGPSVSAEEHTVRMAIGPLRGGGQPWAASGLDMEGEVQISRDSVPSSLLWGFDFFLP